MDELESMCRACALFIDSEPDSTSNKEKSPLNMMKTLFPDLKLRKTMKGPYKLCSLCLEIVLDCIKFRKMVTETELLYKNRINELTSLNVAADLQTIFDSCLRRSKRRKTCLKKKQIIDEGNHVEYVCSEEVKVEEAPLMFTLPESGLGGIKTYTNTKNTLREVLFPLPEECDTLKQDENLQTIEYLEEDKELLFEHCKDILQETPECSPETTECSPETTEAAAEEIVKKGNKPKYNSFVSVEPKPMLLYQCNYCKQTFPKKFLVRDHLKKSHKSQELPSSVSNDGNAAPYACKVCTRVCVSLDALKMHVDYFHSECNVAEFKKMLNCMYCYQTFLHGAALIKHERNCLRVDESYSEERPYLCSRCPNTYRLYGSLERHERVHGFKHKCTLCSKSFNSPETLQAHAQKHRSHTCEICPKTFCNLTLFEQHLYAHTNVKQHECNKCAKRFITKCSLAKHMKLHCDLQSCLCEYCGKLLANRSAKDRHYYHQHNVEPAAKKKKFKCSLCPEQFASTGARLYHKRKLHEPDKMLACDRCPKKFALKSTLDAHALNAHTGADRTEKRYMCEFCGRAFALGVNLRRHEKTHTGERPFGCRYCAKAFIQKSTLRVHEETHCAALGDAKFMCHVCSKMYHGMHQLKRHMSNCHTSKPKKLQKTKKNAHGRQPAAHVCCGVTYAKRSEHKIHVTQKHLERLIRCTACSKTFLKQKNLEQHMRVHDDVRPFQCAACDKSFVRKQALEFHSRLHAENSKRFSCEHCGRLFTIKTNCLRHQRTHTGERPFSCQLCAKTFADSFSLKCHMDVHTAAASHACTYCDKTFKHVSSMHKHKKKCHLNVFN